MSRVASDWLAPGAGQVLLPVDAVDPARQRFRSSHAHAMLEEYAPVCPHLINLIRAVGQLRESAVRMGSAHGLRRSLNRYETRALALVICRPYGSTACQVLENRV
jgi:hypothetical protein